MKGIRDLLEKRNILRLGGDIEIDEKTIFGVFRDATLGEIKNLSPEDIQEIYLKKKTLYVKTIHPAVASEIWRKREGIKKKINEIIKNERISEIRLK
jgi:hypothetical protein